MPIPNHNYGPPFLTTATDIDRVFMSSVTSPTPQKKATITIPQTTTATNESNKKESSSKERPDFVVPVPAVDCNLPLGVSVSKFNKSHIVLSQQRLLIKGGHVVNDDGTTLADVFIEEGLIKQIGLNLIIPGGTKVIDAQGKYILPGGIDTNTQFELSVMGTKSIDDFFTGTKAAIAGGTTTIFDLVIPAREQSLIEAYQEYREQADSKVVCDYGLHVAITDWNEQISKEMEVLVKDKGVNSFHVFMGYADRFMLADHKLFQVFSKCRELGVICTVHAENGLVIKELEADLLKLNINGPEGHILSRPEELEAESVHRAISIAEQARCPLYIARVASKGAADQIRQARRNGNANELKHFEVYQLIQIGQLVYGECFAASLASDGSHYFDKSWRHAAAFVTSPPLRNNSNTGAELIDHLANGSLSTTASVHCTFNGNQKALGKDNFTKIPHGANGVEERLSILWTKAVETGKLDINQFVAVTSSNGARIFNIYPKKGRVAVGSDADCVIWDPQGTKLISAATQQGKCDFNIFEGFFSRGTPIVTIVGGKVLFEEGQFHLQQGSGKYVERKAFNDFIYEKLKKREQIREQFFSKVKVEREPYTLNVVETKKSTTVEDEKNKNKNQSSQQKPQESNAAGFHSRPATRAGGRNLFDSSFTLSGQQWDDSAPRKPTRFHQPPGGPSKGLW